MSIHPSTWQLRTLRRVIWFMRGMILALIALLVYSVLADPAWADTCVTPDSAEAPVNYYVLHENNHTSCQEDALCISRTDRSTQRSVGHDLSQWGPWMQCLYETNPEDEYTHTVGMYVWLLIIMWYELRSHI